MRSLVTAVAASILLLTLTACNPFTDPYEDEQRDGGISPSQAEQTLLSIEGISDADYETYEWYSPGEGGLFSSSGMDVVLTVTVDPEYSVDDDKQFLEYLAATAWSVNDHYPKGSVVIQLIGGADVNYDWLSVVRQVFASDTQFSNPRSVGYDDDDSEWYLADARSLSVTADEYGERFGRWPIDEVDVPSGLLKHEPVAPILLPAITDLELVITQIGEKQCYRLDFERSGQSAGYYGEVTSTLLSATGEEIQTVTGQSNASNEYFCFEEDDFPEGASVEVSTGEYADHEFEPVTETVELSDS